MRLLAGLSTLRRKQVEVRTWHRSDIPWLYSDAIVLYIKIVICVVLRVPPCVRFWIVYCVHTIECSADKFWHVVVSDGKCIVSELVLPATEGAAVST